MVGLRKIIGEAFLYENNEPIPQRHCIGDMTKYSHLNDSNVTGQLLDDSRKSI